MNVIFPLQNSEPQLAQTVVAIGVFDGVHVGHQEILRQTVREARSQGYTPVALTFDIHPTQLLAPQHSPTYISSLAQRAKLIGEYSGVETVAIARFDPDFAALSPEEFVSEILERRLRARHILVGADFCYGRARAGNVTTLLNAGSHDGFPVTIVPPVLVDGTRISSTQIRSLLASGDLPAAITLLGHSFVITGRIVSGKRLGRTLGFPTANLFPDQTDQQIPGNGIYAARATLQDGRSVRAAVSIGSNPTTDTDGLQKIEAYLMDDFDEDIYGQTLALDFKRKIRDEYKFDSLDALVSQIKRDVSEVANCLEAIS